MEKMKFGELDRRELAMAKERHVEAVRKGMPVNMDPFEIAVTVYVNGKIVFHGGHTVGLLKTKGIPDRMTVRMIAAQVIGTAMAREDWTDEERNALVEPVVDVVPEAPKSEGGAE